MRGERSPMALIHKVTHASAAYAIHQREKASDQSAAFLASISLFLAA